MRSTDFAEYVVTDLLSEVSDVRYRAMFGGFGIYKGDVMFGLIADDELYFKVTDENRADYEHAESRSFVYHREGKAVELSYWLVPAEVMDDSDMLAVWALKAHEAAVNSKS